ncbi:MAG: carbohydrate deacetylase [Lachnospiraceae bacterium]
MQKKLIITADDYGMCDSVNRAIDACIDARVVLSTNVMTNMAAANEASVLKKKHPYVSVGLHYNFTVGSPISPIDKVRSLVNKDGEFLSYPRIREKCRDKTYNFNEIICEMKAQWERGVEIFGTPDYWNTHENVHVYPRLYQLFTDQSLNFGIAKMRSHQRIFIPASTGKSDKSLQWKITNPMKQMMLNLWQHSSTQKGVYAPDGLLVRMNEDDKLNLEYLFAHIVWGKKQIAEVAIHPSKDGNNKYYGEITELRVKEYECFSSPEVLNIAKKNNIDIVGFEAVGKSI